MTARTTTTSYYSAGGPFPFVAVVVAALLLGLLSSSDSTARVVLAVTTTGTGTMRTRTTAPFSTGDSSSSSSSSSSSRPDRCGGGRASSSSGATATAAVRRWQVLLAAQRRKQQLGRPGNNGDNPPEEDATRILRQQRRQQQQQRRQHRRLLLAAQEWRGGSSSSSSSSWRDDDTSSSHNDGNGNDDDAEGGARAHEDENEEDEEEEDGAVEESYRDYYFDHGHKSADDDVVVSIVPDAILPRSLSGMSLAAFRYHHHHHHHHQQGTLAPAANDADADDVRLTALPPPPPVPVLPSPPPLSRPSALSSLHLEGGGVDDGTDLAMRSVRWAAFKNRTGTAAVLATFLGLVSYYFHEDGLVVLCILLQCLMYGETTAVIGGSMNRHNFQKWWWLATALIATDGPRLVPWNKDATEAVACTMAVTSVVGTTIRLHFTNAKPSDFRELLRQAAVSLLGIVLVVFPSSFWVATLQEYGTGWILGPALLVILNDTAAYIGGVLFGRNALLPAISPKKTREGFAVAALVTVGLAWAVGTASWGGTTTTPLSLLLPEKIAAAWYPLDKTDGLVMAAFASFVAPFGGFLASIVKRAYGQKDFGSTLPGHGGVVDRLDCQLVMAPFVYLYLTLRKFAATAATTATTS